MNWLTKLLGGSSAIGELALQIRQAIKGKEIDPDKALEMIQKLNEAEAHHRSVWVAGWRPYIGWICGSILAFNFIIAPIIVWLIPETTPPTLNSEEIYPILMGMLGIAGMRSYDKLKNKTK